MIERTNEQKDIQRRVDEWDHIEAELVDPPIPGEIPYGGHRGSFKANRPLPECPFCGTDELWVNPVSGKLGCYACGGLKR